MSKVPKTADSTNKIELPWSDHEDVNINVPCKLCREQAISASGGKYCSICYKELIAAEIFGKR